MCSKFIAAINAVGKLSKALWIISVQFSCAVMSDSLWSHGLQHARLPCPSPTPRACSNSCPSSWWCCPTISSSILPFSSHLQSFPASGSFPKSPFLASGGQSIGVSASASVLPMNMQNWFPLGLTGWISLQSKGLSGVFSSTTVWKHQFFGAQPSLGFLVAQLVKNPPAVQETPVWFLGWEDPLEKAIQSSIHGLWWLRW